jgi:hypothetical protein
MPDPDPNVVEVVATVGVPKKVDEPLEPFTCPWAKDGLAKALEAMKKASGGVLEYHIGSRGLKRESSKAQIDNVGYWNQMVQQYCPGDPGLPTSITGRDTAARVVMRDV